MRKYIGTSIISQKKKNMNMSTARNTPITPPRIHIRLRWKKPTLRWISFHEQNTEQAGQQHHQQRQAVDGQVHADAEAGDPRLLEFDDPSRIDARRRREVE